MERLHLLHVSQAERIIDKFGGVPALLQVLNEADPSITWNKSSIYRWLYPKEKGGTGGVIPTRAMVPLFRAARLAGIILTPEDFYPGKRLA